MTTLQKSALVITILGALNWGLIGLFDFNIVASLFGADSVLTNITYSLIGLCGLFNIAFLFAVHEDRDYGNKK